MSLRRSIISFGMWRGKILKCAYLVHHTWLTILIQTTNGTFCGQMVVSKWTNSIEWNLISASTISLVCTHWLERTISQGTYSACRTYIPRITSSSLRPGSCPPSTENSGSNSVIRQRSVGSKTVRHLSPSLKQPRKVVAYFWLATWRILTHMSIMSSRGTCTNHSSSTSWSLTLESMFFWVVWTRYVSFSTRRVCAGWPLLSIGPLTRTTSAISTCTWRTMQ